MKFIHSVRIFSFILAWMQFSIAFKSTKVDRLLKRPPLVLFDQQVVISKSFALWISNESLNSLFPKSAAVEVIKEIKKSKIIDKNELEFSNFWKSAEEKLREEKRSLKAVIGDDGTSKILAFIDKTDIYDPVTVRAFLQTPAFEGMMGSILYEGIFEFLKRVDIIGNIVNNLPIIGPIRQTIVKEFKIALDKTLGSQVKTFLATFNRVAVQRMVEFVLSTENKEALARANRNLVESVLSRPCCDLIPSTDDSERTKKFIFSAITNAPESDLLAALDTLYEKVGDLTISKYLDLASFMEAVPTIEVTVDTAIDRFMRSSQGKEVLAQLK